MIQILKKNKTQGNMMDLEIITLTNYHTTYNMSDGERCQDEEISYKGDSRQGVWFFVVVVVVLLSV